MNAIAQKKLKRYPRFGRSVGVVRVRVYRSNCSIPTIIRASKLRLAGCPQHRTHRLAVIGERPESIISRPTSNSWTSYQRLGPVHNLPKLRHCPQYEPASDLRQMRREDHSGNWRLILNFTP